MNSEQETLSHGVVNNSDFGANCVEKKWDSDTIKFGLFRLPI
jgi:hypothetical protein